MSLNKKQKNDSKTSDGAPGGRTSLYFAPSEQDLLDFVNSQDVKRNKFIINLIREAYERQKTEILEKQSAKPGVTNEDLLNEIKSLKSFIENHSFKVVEGEEVESDENDNVLPVANDAELMKMKFNEEMDEL